MKTLYRRLHRDNKGFTLVELLIVVAILGVLAAIIVPNVTGLVGTGEPEAASTEHAIVQAAVDMMMIKGSVSDNLTTAATGDMSAFPSGHPIYPDYVRSATTTGTYSCDPGGTVIQETTGY
jgi:prepilin-type N-terminal cleavage/methylation domain-containing protein